MSIEAGSMSVGASLGAVGGPATAGSFSEGAGSMGMQSFAGAETFGSSSSGLGEYGNVNSSLFSYSHIGSMQYSRDLGDLAAPNGLPTLTTQTSLDFLSVRPFADFDKNVAILDNSPYSILDEVSDLLAFANEADDDFVAVESLLAINDFTQDEIASDAMLTENIMTSFADLLPTATLESLVASALEDKKYTIEPNLIAEQALDEVAIVTQEEIVEPSIFSDYSSETTRIVIAKATTDEVAVATDEDKAPAQLVMEDQAESTKVSTGLTTEIAKETLVASQTGVETEVEPKSESETVITTTVKQEADTTDKQTTIITNAQVVTKTETATQTQTITQTAREVEGENVSQVKQATKTEQDVFAKNEHEDPEQKKAGIEFIQDEKTNQKRKNAIVKVVEQTIDGKNASLENADEVQEEIAGSELEQPPLEDSPQAIEEKSEIIKKSPISDGTIPEINKTIAKTVFNIEDIESVVDQIINANTAVDIGKGRSVTRDEVDKVLRHDDQLPSKGIIFSA